MESFIKAIENRKFDPLPKLIYADYLDEQGNEESEFWRWIGNTRIEPEEMIHCNTFFLEY